MRRSQKKIAEPTLQVLRDQRLMSNLEDLPKPVINRKGQFNHPWPWKEVGPKEVFTWFRSDSRGRSAWLTGIDKATEADWKKAFPLHQPQYKALLNPPSNAIQATWIGHASFLVQMGGVNFLTDPIFSQRCSPVQWLGAKRLVQPPFSVDDPQMPKIDFVVISHDHYDHLDYNSVKQLHQRYGDDLHWYVPLKLGSWFKSMGIAPGNIHELDWWQEFSHKDTGVNLTFTPAQHWSKRTPWTKRTTLWGGYIVKSGKLSFYFTGDTAYCPAFKLIGEKYGPFDLALIPVGAYHPREVFGQMHCAPEEAVQIHQEVKSKRSIGMHCCTFHMTGEALDEPPRLLKEELKKAGVSENIFSVIQHGSTLATANGQDMNDAALL